MITLYVQRYYKRILDKAGKFSRIKGMLDGVLGWRVQQKHSLGSDLNLPVCSLVGSLPLISLQRRKEHLRGMIL